MMFTSSPRSVSQVAKAPDLQHVNAARAAPAATAVATDHALAVGDGRELVQLELDLGLRRLRRRGLHNHLIHLLRFRSQGERADPGTDAGRDRRRRPGHCPRVNGAAAMAASVKASTPLAYSPPSAATTSPAAGGFAYRPATHSTTWSVRTVPSHRSSSPTVASLTRNSAG